MNKELAVKIIKASFETMRNNSNQYGVPPWKFEVVIDSIKKAENALSYLENNTN